VLSWTGAGVGAALDTDAPIRRERGPEGTPNLRRAERFDRTRSGPEFAFPGRNYVAWTQSLFTPLQRTDDLHPSHDPASLCR
jgi:hypothetical protein